MEQEPYRYRSAIIECWVNKSELINGYHIAAFAGFLQKQSNDYELEDIVDLIILPVIGVLGIIGNIKGIICFSKKVFLTYYSLLLALAISDLITILTFIFYFTIPRLLNHYTILEHHSFAYAILSVYFLLNLSQLIDIYLLVALSCDRFLAICHPITYRSRKISILSYLFPIICFSICCCIPILFEYQVDEFSLEKYRLQEGNYVFVGNTTLYLVKQTDLKLFNNHYKVIYETIGKLVVKCVVPYLVLITTNALILRAFVALKFTQKKQENEEGSENDTEEKEAESMEGNKLRIHTSSKGVYLRESQVNLAFLNLVIAIVFLLCYSLLWIWIIHDCIILLKSSLTKVCF